MNDGQDTSTSVEVFPKGQLTSYPYSTPTVVQPSSQKRNSLQTKGFLYGAATWVILALISYGFERYMLRNFTLTTFVLFLPLLFLNAIALVYCGWMFTKTLLRMQRFSIKQRSKQP